MAGQEYKKRVKLLFQHKCVRLQNPKDCYFAPLFRK